MRRYPKLSLTPFLEALPVAQGAVMAEIGSYAGESTEMFTRSGKFKRICAIDPWENWESPDHMGDNMAAVEADFDKRKAVYPNIIVKVKGRSPEAAGSFPDGSLNLVYVDGFHDYETVKQDILAWIPKLKDGGIMSGHDYSPGFPGVKKAVDEIFGMPDRVFPDSSWLVKRNFKEKMIMDMKDLRTDYVFCHPGNPSSAEQSLNCEFIRAQLMSEGKKIAIASADSCNIYAVRNMCVSVRSDAGYRKDQKPFAGICSDYTHAIWVDSDNIINAAQVKRLLSHDVDMVAGWYLQKRRDGKRIAACGYWDVNPKYRHIAQLSDEKLMQAPRNEKGLVEVDYAGFGLMVMKKGVIESLEYPWFRSWVFEWEEDGIAMADIMTDDAGFCLRAKEKGFRVYVDPEVRLGHQKAVTI
jgi:hypothetical protein